MKKLIFFIMIACASVTAEAKELFVVTSTQTLADIVKALGGTFVKVENLSRGTEDPHYVEAKPSFMVKVRDADMVVVIGLELEKAWMDGVLTGSRNPKVLPGGKGYLDLGSFIPALEKVSGRLDRSQGDVHPLGNPHYYLDPVRIKDVLPKVTEKLVELVPERKADFERLLKSYSDALDGKIQAWKARVQKLKTKNVITYHRTLVYFLDRFQMSLKSTIEPKPGIPPSASHTLELIKLAKGENINCILNESHFETVAAKRISKEIGSQVSVVPTEVGALPGADTYIELIEKRHRPGGMQMTLENLTFLLPAFAMCLILVGIHCYLGLHVLARNVLFVDLALAQVAALGTTVAFAMGFDHHERGAFFVSLGFTFLAAFLFTLAGRVKGKISIEAFVGIVYAFASALVILVIDKISHGAEHLKYTLVGQILWTDWDEVRNVAIIYACVAAIHFYFRKKMIDSSFSGKGHWFWDFLFFALFGVVITCSVSVSGVLLVFAFLIVPAVLSSMIVKTLSARLWLGWLIGIALCSLGILVSFKMDLPPGATQVVVFTVLPIVVVAGLGIKSLMTAKI